MICTFCETPLSGGRDTFGDFDLPICCECWCQEMPDMAPVIEPSWKREIVALALTTAHRENTGRYCRTTPMPPGENL